MLSQTIAEQKGLEEELDRVIQEQEQRKKMLKRRLATARASLRHFQEHAAAALASPVGSGNAGAAA